MTSLVCGMQKQTKQQNNSYVEPKTKQNKTTKTEQIGSFQRRGVGA